MVRTCAWCLCFFTLGMIVPLPTATATPPPGQVSVEVADLKQQLESGLRARRPQEFRFIARVVQLVENNTLPVPLVKGTFQWARKRKVRYPFPYFERALRLRAAKIGVSI